MKREQILEMPAEKLFTLVCDRPVNPVIYRVVFQERLRPDVLQLYNTLKPVAGWR